MAPFSIVEAPELHTKLAERTIVRPTILTNGPRTGAYRVLVDPRD
jgi:hypothetical protein